MHAKPIRRKPAPRCDASGKPATRLGASGKPAPRCDASGEPATRPGVLSKPAADRISADRISADRISADRISADGAAADRLTEGGVARDRLEGNPQRAAKLRANRRRAAARQAATALPADRLPANRLPANRQALARQSAAPPERAARNDKTLATGRGSTGAVQTGTVATTGDKGEALRLVYDKTAAETAQALEAFLSTAKKNGLKQEALLRRAADFAENAHRGQFRRDGAPYITHPLAVAGILADMQADTESLVTGLLHDTVEDTPVSLEEVRKKFGEEVAFLVDGVTKISRIHFQNVQRKQSENIRKMIAAMGKDVRVILVKLADRLHNMRTLAFLPEEKQLFIADETLEIYAPLASRLGMNRLKAELEDLSFRRSRPEACLRLEKKMRESGAERVRYAKEVVRLLKKELSPSLKKGFEIQGRAKNLYSIYCKMRDNDLDFEQIHDISAFRVCVEKKPECYKVLGLIHAFWKPVPGRFKDFIAMPKANSYQSLHTAVIGPKGRPIEVQIRTKEMHLIAERGVAAHWIYKSGKKSDKAQKAALKPKTLEKFNYLQDLANQQAGEGESGEFLDNIKRELFESEVYVFTPAGDIKEFPKGAGPVDFAYAIHTDIGASLRGAKVNGRQVPLKYKLQSGDTVEVITSKTGRPSKDWLNMCVTSRARSKIQAFVKAEERKKALQIGEKIWEKSRQKFKTSEKRVFEHPRFQGFMKDKGFNKKEDLLTALGFGRLSADHIFRELNKNTEKTLSPVFEKQKKSAQKTSRSAILVDGDDQIMISFAKCCRPVSGDPISAYVSRSKGVSIHRSGCASLSIIPADRFVDVKWKKSAETEEKNLYEVSLQVLCGDSPGALNNMSEAFTVMGLNITGVQILRRSDQKALAVFTTDVRDLRQLRELTGRLHAVENVISVKRKSG